MAGGHNEKVGKRVHAFQESSCQTQASLKSHNLLAFATCVINIPVIHDGWKCLKKIKTRRHGGTCHLIPAAGMTCEDLIQQCHQLFVKEKR